MRAIVNIASNELEMQQMPVPQPGPGQARIRTSACGVCATDLEMISGWDRTTFPAVPGHEWSGKVDAVGAGVDGALVGQKCVAENVLRDGGEVGFEHSGAYGEYLITDGANIHVLPSDFPMVTAALIEPLAVSVRALRRLRDDVSDPVLVLGDGPIGLLLLALIKNTQSRQVVFVGGRQSRLQLAQEIGADKIFNYHEMGSDLATSLRQAAGRKFPSIIEAAGSASALEASMQLIERCGRLLLVGEYGHSKAGFPWSQLLIDELELIGSNASADAWPEAVRLAVEGVIPLRKLITHVLPPEDFQQAIELTRTDRNMIKVVMEWEKDA
jgi:2-desacetyl-2-hydroxyethyl bacteriochlorophyllide A dehydrogenase